MAVPRGLFEAGGEEGTLASGASDQAGGGCDGFVLTACIVSWREKMCAKYCARVFERGWGSEVKGVGGGYGEG